MIKFDEIKYSRIDISFAVSELKKLTASAATATSGSSLVRIREKTMLLSKDVATAATIAQIRFLKDMPDDYYLAEHSYYDENLPLYNAECVNFAKAFLLSPHLKAAEGLLGAVVTKLYEITARVGGEAVVAENIEEAKLVTKYSMLMSSLEIKFQGKSLPLSIVEGYTADANRLVRAEAMEAIGRALAKESETLDGLFDRLVKVRARKARKLGFSSYAELGDLLMNRYSYGRKEIREFREQIIKTFVPKITELKTSVAKSLGISELTLYDNEVYFKSGNPVPFKKISLTSVPALSITNPSNLSIADPSSLSAPTPQTSPAINNIAENSILTGMRSVFTNLGSETQEFFARMDEFNAFDLDSRKNKWGGGFCATVPSHNMPYILGNFNGACSDVELLAHELGHGYAAYLQMKNGDDYELSQSITMSVAEVHSMSMEFLLHPYAPIFFDRPQDFRRMHLNNALSFIPYACLVDEFEETVYNHPCLSPDNRNNLWLKLEKKYRPHLSSENIPYLEFGTRWQYQSHIFESPMYYIDYALAESIALEFHKLASTGLSSALSTYDTFIKHSSRLPLKELCALCNLKAFTAPTINPILS